MLDKFVIDENAKIESFISKNGNEFPIQTNEDGMLDISTAHYLAQKDGDKICKSNSILEHLKERMCSSFIRK